MEDSGAVAYKNAMSSTFAPDFFQIFFIKPLWKPTGISGNQQLTE